MRVLLDLGPPKRDGVEVSRDQLENRIHGWGEEVSSNAVDVLIHRMRRKLGADTIRNVRGLGWRIAASAPPPTSISGLSPLLAATGEVS